MRKKIYETVHVYNGNPGSIIYKYFMILATLVSILPLMTKEDYSLFRHVDGLCIIIFILDFFLRWLTADYKFGTKKISAFLKYPFRIISIIDIAAILALMCSYFGWLEGLVAAEVFAVFRIIRIFRYSKNARMILDILKKSRKPLTAVGGLAFGYIFVSAILIFNIEPESFNTFFDAIYWSTVSLTTVGYGDIYPVTVVGRAVAMISSFFGIAIVALPAGIVTAEYMNSIKKED
ncbi:MAG: potassium channel family protein [Ruminococcaceae bacterium]|nr:potassium channel family protein [Oscillospiraceae bacterium]